MFPRAGQGLGSTEGCLSASLGVCLCACGERGLMWYRDGLAAGRTGKRRREAINVPALGFRCNVFVG